MFLLFGNGYAAFSCCGGFILEHGADLLAQFRWVLVPMYDVCVEHAARPSTSFSVCRYRKLDLGKKRSASLGLRVRDCFACRENGNVSASRA